MAPKILIDSSSLLLLLFLLSNIVTANATTPFTSSELKILHYKGLMNNNIINPSSRNRVFHILPKGNPVPPSGASKRRNVLQSYAEFSQPHEDLKTLHHHKGLNSHIEDDARVRSAPVRRHASDCIPSRMLHVHLPKRDPIPPPGSPN